MLTVLALVISQFGATEAEELAARVDVLRFQIERIAAITVPEAQQAEKDAKLATLKQRMDAGIADGAAYNAAYLAIDDVRTWLLANATERPARVQGEFKDEGGVWSVHTDALDFRWNQANFAMTVKTPACEWAFDACDDRDVQCHGKAFSLLSAATRKAEPFNTGYSAGMTLTLADFPGRPGFELHLTVNLIGNEVVFEMAAKETEQKLYFILWPKPILMTNTETELSVIPHMQGMLLPGNWPQEIHQGDLFNSRSFYMPWWGQIRNGCGVQVIFETSDDAGGVYDHPAGGPTRIAPKWFASLGQVRYLRTVRYVFDDNATYVTQAKRYRRYVQETGRFVTLEEKRTRTPGLNEVIGRPVIHAGALYHFVQTASLFNKDRIESNHAMQTFDQIAEGLRKLKADGIDTAYVHLDGWGFYGYDNGHPDVMPVGEEQGGWDGLRRFADTCRELGYLFAVHDQYRDFYLNAASFDDRLAVTRLDGGRDEASVWCGGPQTMLNPRFAPEYVRRNHDAFAAHGIKVRGAYLDVFSVVPLEESALPAHPVTRTECGEFRRDCFDLLRARGYVVSSEEPSDYLARSLDLVHHGPYATLPNLGGGNASGIPVPLFNLVYHDSLLEPWDMGEDGGWGIPNGDAGRLHCVLNAGLPYVGPGAPPEHIARVKEAAALAARCGTLEMTNHEFLDASMRKQRSTFSDGTQVTVDFNAKTSEIQYAK